MNRSNRFISPTGSEETPTRAGETNYRNNCAEAFSGSSLATPQDESSYRTEEARRLIQSELERNDIMTKDRKNVLRSALNFVSGFSHVPPASLPDQSDLELEKDLNVGSTAPEMLYMMLPGSY